MRFYHFAVVIEKEPQDEGYSAYSPSLPGCFSHGRTLGEARRNLREAMEQHVAALLAHELNPKHSEASLLARRRANARR